MNEFAVTNLASLQVILKAYLQAVVSFNTGRQIAHPGNNYKFFLTVLN